MSCKLLVHSSISTYIYAINIVLTGPCGHLLSLSHNIPIAVITSDFAVSFVLSSLHSGLKHFQHCFSALILFGGNWGAEIAEISCVGI